MRSLITLFKKNNNPKFCHFNGTPIFTNSPNVIIECPENSTAHNYVVKNNISYNLIKDGTQKPNDPIEEFVIRNYKYTLERTPAQEETNYWIQRLQSGVDGGASFATSLFLSDEFIVNGYSNRSFIILLYHGLLGRNPDISDLNYWTNKLAKETSRPNMIMEFMSTPEFPNLCAQYGIDKGDVSDTFLSDANRRVFIVRMYQDVLNRAHGINGLNYWNTSIHTGAYSVYDVAYSFVCCEEVENKNLSKREFIILLYRGFMSREPGTDGYNFYLKRLNGNNFTEKDMFNEFYESPEFQAIKQRFKVE